MNLFLYLDRRTFIHRLDPRTKIIGILIGFALCLCFNHPFYMALISLCVMVIALLAGSVLNFWRFRFVLLLLIVFSTMLWPFFVETTPSWIWGPFKTSREAVYYGIAMGLRLPTFVALGLVFLSTTRNEELTNGLIRLGLPYPIAFALSTSLRLVPTFAGAGATIVEAQISRGLDLKSGSIFRRIGKFIPLAVPLFLYAIRHTNFLAMALESKGFDTKAKRTLYYEPQMHRADYIVIGSLTSILIVFLYLRIGLHRGVILPGRL